MIDFNKKKNVYILLGLLTLLSYPAFFYHLASFPLVTWDESRQAVNAFEMIQNNNWLVAHFNGSPDLWNTKPPLFIWILALLMKIFGYSLLVVRLPSALIGLVSIWLLVYISKKYFNETRIGIFASLTAMTSVGYLGLHGTRTADFDAILSLFIFLYLVYFFLAADEENERSRKKYFLLFSIFLSLAILSKGIAGIILLPALILYSLLKKKFRVDFRRRWLYMYLAMPVLVTALFYTIRELAAPGYLKAVIGNEISGRYLSVIEQHNHPFDFYYNLLLNERYIPWIYFLLPAFLVSASRINGNRKARNASQFFIVCSLFYFLVISFAKTKLFWYDLPLYLQWAFILGTAMYVLYNHAMNSIANPVFREHILLPLVAAMIFMIPFQREIKAFTHPKFDTNSPGHYLLLLKQKMPALKNVTFIYPNEQILVYYKNVIALKGVNAKISDFKNFHPELKDTIILTDPQHEKLLMTHYNCRLLDENEKTHCRTFVLEGSLGRPVAEQVSETVLAIRNNPDWLSWITEKSRTRGISLDILLTLEALYVLEEEKAITKTQRTAYEKANGLEKY